MTRTGVKDETRELAMRLVRFEAASKGLEDNGPYVTCRVCEKLRRPLTTLTGASGFTSLLLRAFTLARREAPVLLGARVDADGFVEGLDGEAAKATPVLVAHLLTLLITFIGETLTMHILQDIWRDMPGLTPTPVRKEPE